MYSYDWDEETGGLLLHTAPLVFSKEPRPVYYKELDILGFDKYWNYKKEDTFPYMWAEANNYFYRGRKVAQTKGGTMYTAPELVLLEEPEPNHAPLRFVDVPMMVEKNREIMEGLVQDTIKKIYHTYNEYKNKIDVFYVAFSGGKDSIVTLDIVQRTLPHNAFVVVFGDTGMEFPHTYDVVERISELCKKEGIEFYYAKSHLEPLQTWRKFGPPARKIRWCCTVHKTAPVINELAEITKTKYMHSMMITGVRGYESLSRSNYDELSFGKKIINQYSFHPILEWSSAEVYLYLYSQNLFFNESYKLGFNRIGCIMCPNSSERHEFIKRQFFRKKVDEYCNIIISTSNKDLSGDNCKIFLENGGWKARLTGRELNFSEEEKVEFQETSTSYIFKVTNLKDEWKIWYKTLGEIMEKANGYILEYDNQWRNCCLIKKGEKSMFIIENLEKNKNSIEFIHLFKNLLIKSQYCIQCKTCVSECSYRNISMKNGILSISDECIKCHKCLRILNGCLYYNSVRGSKAVKSLKGVDRYLSVGVDSDWIKNYLKDDSFVPGNRKTDAMFCFMSDAGIVFKRKFTRFGRFVQQWGINEIHICALMICNLVYTPAFNWYICHIPFNEYYTKQQLEIDMGDDVSEKVKSTFWNGFKTILDTNMVFQNIGLGVPNITIQKTKIGEKKKMNSICRKTWENPDPRVILYSLYKFAEACNGYYQFTLTRLLNHSIDSDGVSPTQIFGLEREEMEKILSGLSINYPEYINATFTLDLDNINLYSDKTSQDILTLF